MKVNKLHVILMLGMFILFIALTYRQMKALEDCSSKLPPPIQQETTD